MKITVNVPDKYDILFCKVPELDGVVVTDENVNELYPDEFKNNKKIVLSPGEATKSIKHLEHLYNEFAKLRLTRSDQIIAFGGGVIGDLTGFAGATYLRGIPFIQVPTSLLAQIDSSVGGKVAINTEYGKNLVGNFYQPKAVYIDTNYLKTLPIRAFADGMAELIKHAAIKDYDLWQALSGDYDINDVVQKSCIIKARIVEQDERDTGVRMLLNFGHTIGHAIETYYKYEKYTHGEAVAIGMYVMARIGEENGLTKIGTSDRIKDMLLKFNLPYEIDVPISDIIDIIAKDKKIFGKDINLIMLKEIGESYIYRIGVKDFENHTHKITR